MSLLIPAIAFAIALVLLLLDIDPVPTWFYVFAWYPTLLILDALAHRKDREPVLRNPRLILSLFGWSVVIWLVFEAANFRLDNWYYVFLPRNGVERWAGIVLAFATVLPAVLLAERALDAFGAGKRWRTRPFTLRGPDLHLATLLGLGQLAVALAWPRLFFPFIWGATFLLAEPFVYRRRPELSLFADLERGDWGRVGRLMLGGLGIGLIWESYNYWARGKWVYTVPWLEGTKWFEMPPFGFVGFAFFALEAWSMYAALCAAGVALPLNNATRLSRARVTAAGLIALGFSVTILLGMERWTISSVVPRLADLPGITAPRASALSQAGVRTPFALARSAPATLGTLDGISEEEGAALAAAARLAILRGIGAEHLEQLRQIGIQDICNLSREEPTLLWTAIHLNEPRKRPTQAEVRVWVGGARAEC